jgi:acyl carrier protein
MLDRAMSRTREAIMADVLNLLHKLASDWEYAGAVVPGTRLFADLGFESLDVVVLGTALQEQYQRAVPFAQFLAEVGQRDVRDISVGELVDFFYTHLADVPAGVPPAPGLGTD